jgi:hypothetical protein
MPSSLMRREDAELLVVAAGEALLRGASELYCTMLYVLGPASAMWSPRRVSPVRGCVRSPYPLSRSAARRTSYFQRQDPDWKPDMDYTGHAGMVSSQP